ncbi:MAG: anthranilate phosphoribosyltransferase, partial [Herpetosiphon sp.]|nr:anthranilate phosphoribosyltransferase [Herpetosiphon sp.]
MHIRDAIIAVTSHAHLSQDDAAAVMEQMMNGEASPAQIGALLTAMHLKGETDAEIAGMAQIMRAKSVAVPHDGSVVDTCGTGGD